MSKPPVFPQLDRLAEYERREPVRKRPQRETPLDEIFTPEGVPARKDDDET